MANPQKENGYTAIANEIMDALIKYRIPGEQRQCLDYIIRKTYGFNKKEDMISNSQFVRATGLNKSHICRAINGLIDKNIVAKKGNKHIPSYRFNKNYNQWKVLPKKVTVAKKGNKVLPKKGPTKDSITKDTFLSDSIEIRLSELLFNLILKNNPKAKKPNFQSWAKEIDLMIRIDKRRPDEIETVIRWCQTDDFWYANILSTVKLRKQFDQLTLKMSKKPEKQKKIITGKAALYYEGS